MKMAHYLHYRNGMTSTENNTTVKFITRAMLACDVRAERGALVLPSELRTATGLAKDSFDGLCLYLASRGILSLHRHDFVSSLSAAEREELIDDLYCGVALRQS